MGDRSVLELFHGPTLAFKDVAMQLLGNFYEFYLNNENEKINIVVATSAVSYTHLTLPTICSV